MIKSGPYLYVFDWGKIYPENKLAFEHQADIDKINISSSHGGFFVINNLKDKWELATSVQGRLRLKNCISYDRHEVITDLKDMTKDDYSIIPAFNSATWNIFLYGQKICVGLINKMHYNGYAVEFYSNKDGIWNKYTDLQRWISEMKKIRCFVPAHTKIQGDVVSYLLASNNCDKFSVNCWCREPAPVTTFTSHTIGTFGDRVRPTWPTEPVRFDCRDSMFYKGRLVYSTSQSTFSLM